jgi:hypothetical protein
MKSRKLSLTELKKLIEAELKGVEDANKVKADQETPWHDADLEKEMDWMKALKIKEFFLRGPQNKQ